MPKKELRSRSTGSRQSGAAINSGGAVEVPIAAIHVEPSLQPRLGGLDGEHVRALQETPDQWPPLAAFEQEGRFALLDGFHRLAAAQNLGLERVQVRAVEAPSDGDLRGLAFALNASHGRPLSLADRRAEATRLLTRDPEVSNMEIARRCALSPTTVQAVRRELEDAEAIEASERRIGRDGASYTAPTRRAGDLPDPGLGEVMGETVGRLFTSKERAHQRKLARYLERLATALADQDELAGWADAEEVAEACRLVLGEEKAELLGETLGRTSAEVYAVAVELGFSKKGRPDAS